MSSSERIQKIIAQAGLASRREAEQLIADGLVTVNGKTAKLGDKANLAEDAIKVKGKLLQGTEAKVYYLFYKPKNVIAMVNEDEEGRDTIKNFTRAIKERVFTVGRMDFSGEGAIILTNDGEMAQKITKSDDLIRRYHVKVDRHPTADDLARLARGGRIEKVSMMPHHIRVVQEYAKNALIEVSFQGSGMTEVRKFFENKGFFPEKVIRVGIGHLKADNMKPGEIRKVDATSMEALFAQPELTKKLIENLVKEATKKKHNADATEGAEESGRTSRSASRRPPRGRPKPAERAMKNAERSAERGFERAPRGERPARAPRAGADFQPRFKREDRGFGDRKPSFGRGAPRGDRFADRAAREDGFGAREQKSFGRGPKPARFGDRSFDRSDRGERKSFGDRKPSFGRGAPRGDRQAFGDRAPRGDRPARSFGGDRPSFGDRARGDRPARSFGERKSFGDRKPSFGRGAPRGDRPARGGSFQPRFKRG